MAAKGRTGMKIFPALFLSAACLMLSRAAPASPAPGPDELPAKIQARGCVDTDLVGSWDLVITQAKNPKDLEGMPRYERWVFEKDGTMKHIASAKPLSAAPEAMLNARRATVHYSLDKNGTLTLKYQDPKATLSMACVYELIGADDRPDTDLPKTGDVLLSYFFNQRESPDLVRRLRRMKGS